MNEIYDNDNINFYQENVDDQHFLNSKNSSIQINQKKDLDLIKTYLMLIIPNIKLKKIYRIHLRDILILKEKYLIVIFRDTFLRSSLTDLIIKVIFYLKII